MFTENGMMVDLEELRRVVENADVFTIAFRTFPQRLIVDARSSDNAGTMVRVVEPVATVEERFFWLGKERPAFGVPERFTFFVWPHSVRYFEESGLGQIIRERIYPLDSDGNVGREVAESMRKLFTLERQSEFDAITGRNYHTLWQREEAEAE
ncbi:MAG: hypothetical protein ABI559_09760 [Chloroflexota bacterium]